MLHALCDLTAILKKSTTTNTGSRTGMIEALFDRAGEAAKNPRHADLAVFLSSLAPEKVERLTSLFTTVVLVVYILRGYRDRINENLLSKKRKWLRDA